MATDVIMPALGMSQDTGTLLQWLTNEGQDVVKGEPLMEIETDKVVVTIDAPASGILANVTAAPGETIPVGQTIALILAPGESAGEQPRPERGAPHQARMGPPRVVPPVDIRASPLAIRVAAEHNLDLAAVRPKGDRIEKADVLAHLDARRQAGLRENGFHLPPASPKARRLARERDLDTSGMQQGSGPEGAVLSGDVLALEVAGAVPEVGPRLTALGTAWQLMAQRMTLSWTGTPHFFLLREVHAGRLMDWRQQAALRPGEKPTYSDLLVKLVAAALREHPLANAEWREGRILLHSEINVGLAVAVNDGLVVPVIHHADRLSLSEIMTRRQDIVERAQTRKLRPEDVRGGTFTLTNLGMHGPDVFMAIVNPPQAAILAVGRIAERVVAVDRQPMIRPMMVLCLSCDHRAIDGARGAEFLERVASLIEEPPSLLE